MIDQIDKSVFFRHYPKKAMKEIKSRSATEFDRRDEWGAVAYLEREGNSPGQQILADDVQLSDEKKKILTVKVYRNYTPSALMYTCSINNYW